MNKRFGAAIAASLAVVCTAALAASANKYPPTKMHWPVTDKFEGHPTPATPVPGTACEVAGRYAELVATKKMTQIPALFADDGVFLASESNKVLKGPKEIATFYNQDDRVPWAIPLSFIDSGAECIM